ncbi:putative membrane protein YedE/YeeE [Rhodovulum iodosum]|uniref:Membrane protein YedE/YeeE n=1 Tax=Rhodovulum iodosum TaxID=68291 RepID=A0ABV3XQZ2_9RHOB
MIIIAAGLLVGDGMRFGNGCTSGHGVCGISRLSLRGFGATVFYILAGGLTVAMFREVWGVI